MNFLINKEGSIGLEFLTNSILKRNNYNHLNFYGGQNLKTFNIIRFCQIIICFLLFFTFGGSCLVALEKNVEGNTLYVSVKGNNSWNGRYPTYQGGLDGPFRFPQKAARVVGAGDTVYIKAGTYPGLLIVNKHGTSSKWIVFRPYQNDTVTFDPYKDKYNFSARAIDVNACSYIKFDGIKMTDSNPLLDGGTWKEYSLNGKGLGHGASIVHNGCHHIKYSHCTIYHVAGSGFMSGPDSHHLEAIDNIFYDIGKSKRGYGLYWLGDYNIIRGNVFHDCYGRAINLWSSYSGKYPDRNLIEKNTCYNNGRLDYGKGWSGFPVGGEPRGTGILVGSNGRDNVVQNNICYGNLLYGIRIYSGQDYTKLINNTCYNNGKYGILLVKNLNGTIVRNNICFKNSWWEYRAFDNVTNTSLDHNIFGTNPDFIDPNNLNPNKRDYQLKPTSQAIDAGSALGAPANDYKGNLRPVDGNGDGIPATDIGAYEYVPNNTSNTRNTVTKNTVTKQTGSESNTLTVQSTATDAFLRDGINSDRNFGEKSYIHLKNSISGYQRVAVIGFDFSKLDDSAVITSAYLDLYYSNNNIGNDPVGETVEVNRLMQADWVEDQVTWDFYKDGNKWITPGGDFTVTGQATTVMPADFGFVRWTVTDQARYAQRNTSEKLQMLVKFASDVKHNSAAVFSSNNDKYNSAMRPKLIINYTTE